MTFAEKQADKYLHGRRDDGAHYLLCEIIAESLEAQRKACLKALKDFYKLPKDTYKNIEDMILNAKIED